MKGGGGKVPGDERVPPSSAEPRKWRYLLRRKASSISHKGGGSAFTEEGGRTQARVTVLVGVSRGLKGSEKPCSKEGNGKRKATFIALKGAEAEATGSA